MCFKVGDMIRHIMHPSFVLVVLEVAEDSVDCLIVGQEQETKYRVWHSRFDLFEQV